MAALTTVAVINEISIMLNKFNLGIISFIHFIINHKVHVILKELRLN